jgi:hypothetical protein
MRIANQGACAMTIHYQTEQAFMDGIRKAAEKGLLLKVFFEELKIEILGRA